MPDDSSGIYSLPAGTIVATGDTILPSQHNPWANDNANAMSNRFSKDGRAPATGNWNLNNFRIMGLGTPVASTDAVTKAYADSTASNNIYTLISANTAVGFADKGKYYRTITTGITVSPGAAATLGANHFFRVKNDSAGIVIIDPSNGLETINGISALIVPSGLEAFVICDGSNFFGSVVGSPQQGPQLQGFISGLSSTTNVGSPSNNIDIAAGAVASSSSPYYLIQLSSGITKNASTAWAVGNNNGSLDTGSVSNSTYYGYLIQRSDTGVVDVLTSLSSTAPTMPTNYDRRSPPLFTFTRTAGVNSTPVPISSNSPSWALLRSTTVSVAVASVDFSDVLSSFYDDYIIIAENVAPSTAAILSMRMALAGTSWITSVYRYAHIGNSGGTASASFSNNAASFQLAIASSLAGTALGSWSMMLHRTATGRTLEGTYTIIDTTSDTRTGTVGCQLAQQAESIQFLMSSGNISSGTFRIYGVRRS